MLWCVFGFGVFTVVFGLSRNLALSLAALALAGACDMVSVIVRQTLIQLGTPDEMRGRVSAVNMVFVGASNEVGQFESGITAQWFGTVPAVVLGGLGTIAVVALWARLFPALRGVKDLGGGRRASPRLRTLAFTKSISVCLGMPGSKQRRQRASYMSEAPTTIRSSEPRRRCVCLAGLPQRTQMASVLVMDSA